MRRPVKTDMSSYMSSVSSSWWNCTGWVNFKVAIGLPMFQWSFIIATSRSVHDVIDDGLGQTLTPTSGRYAVPVGYRGLLVSGHRTANTEQFSWRHYAQRWCLCCQLGLNDNYKHVHFLVVIPDFDYPNLAQWTLPFSDLAVFFKLSHFTKWLYITLHSFTFVTSCLDWQVHTAEFECQIVPGSFIDRRQASMACTSSVVRRIANRIVKTSTDSRLWGTSMRQLRRKCVLDVLAKIVHLRVVSVQMLW